MFAGEAVVVYQNLAVGSAVVDLGNEEGASVCIKCIEAAGSKDRADLGTDDEVASLPTELFDGSAHEDFGLSGGVAGKERRGVIKPAVGTTGGRSDFSAVSKKLTPRSYACFMQLSVPSG
jgi:hypothetical protein